MKITKRGTIQHQRVWKGKCINCISEAEATEDEMTHIKNNNGRRFSREKCPVCGTGRESDYGGMLFSPAKDYDMYIVDVETIFNRNPNGLDFYQALKVFIKENTRFKPDWDQLKVTQESLREHMLIIKYLDSKIRSALIAHPNAVSTLLQEALDRTHLT